MDEKDWKILKILNEERSLTKASRRLHISQPGLTYRINQIEEQFDIKLFSRGKHSLIFTSAGEKLIDYAYKMISAQLRIKDDLSGLHNKVSGELRIGAATNFAHYLLPKLMKEFLSLYPHIKIKIHSGWNMHIIDRLHNQEDHVCITRGDYEWPEKKIYLDEDPLCLVSKHELQVCDLPRLNMIDISLAPETKKAERVWWKSHFNEPPQIGMVVDKVETSKAMILQDLGYSIMPKFIITEDDFRAGIIIKPLYFSDGRPFTRKTCLLFHENTPHQPVKAFTDFICHKFCNMYPKPLPLTPL